MEQVFILAGKGDNVVLDLLDGWGILISAMGGVRFGVREKLWEVFGYFFEEVGELNREGANFEELVQQWVLHSNFIMSYNLYDNGKILQCTEIKNTFSCSSTSISTPSFSASSWTTPKYASRSSSSPSLLGLPYLTATRSSKASPLWSSPLSWMSVIGCFSSSSGLCMCYCMKLLEIA